MPAILAATEVSWAVPDMLADVASVVGGLGATALLLYPASCLVEGVDAAGLPQVAAACLLGAVDKIEPSLGAAPYPALGNGFITPGLADVPSEMTDVSALSSA